MNNPFKCGEFATDEDFIDRERELSELLNLVKLGECVVISSPMGTGKSSLLLEFARRNSKDFIFVYIDSSGITDESALVDVLTKESMRASYGHVENFTQSAWQLLANPRLRRAVIESATSSTRYRQARSLREVADDEGPIQTGNVSARLSMIEIRMCPACGRPLKWIEKYSRHYCYGCKKYAPIRRKVRALKGPAKSQATELRCPRCRADLKFVHRYTEYYCPKCEKYPLLESRRRHSQMPAVADILDALDLPEKIAKERDKKIVVIFDEFQEINAIDGSDIFTMMRDRFEMQTNVSYIFSGSNAPFLDTMFRSKGWAFFNFARPLELRPIPDEDYERYLMEKFKAARGRLSREAASMIVGVSGGYPCHVQKIAHELFHISSTPSLENVERAISAVIRQQSHLYSVLWESVKSPLHKKYLIAIVNEPRVSHGDEFVRRHGLKSRSHVQRIQKQLEARGFIEDDEVVDPMFVLWLRVTASS